VGQEYTEHKRGSGTALRLSECLCALQMAAVERSRAKSLESGAVASPLPEPSSKSFRGEDVMKYGALVILVVQNSALALTMRYSRTVSTRLYISR
jgi:hypothetical protein